MFARKHIIPRNKTFETLEDLELENTYGCGSIDSLIHVLNTGGSQCSRLAWRLWYKIKRNCGFYRLHNPPSFYSAVLCRYRVSRELL